MDESENTYFAQTDLAMMPRTSSSDKPSRHQKGDWREEARRGVTVGNSGQEDRNLLMWQLSNHQNKNKKRRELK